MHQSIKNFSLTEAEKLFESYGEKKFRAKQLFGWIYERNVDDFDSMSDFSLALRNRLKENYSIHSLSLEDRVKSSRDNSEKFLFRTEDNEYIESVFLVSDDSEDSRKTICISSQIGCAMNCTFCSTAKIGFKRNLDVAEIIDQISIIRKETGIKNDNIVYMGMGEPFLNYDNVIKSAQIINYSFGYHISSRRITISTCGILPAIQKYISEKQKFNLAISLNHSDNMKRSTIMPINKKYPIEAVAKAISGIDSGFHGRITLEYVMTPDNISKDDAVRIKHLFANSHIKLNLIPINNSESNLSAPSQNMIDKFVENLSIMNIPVMVRKSFGSDINGACGQLSGKKYKKE